MWTRAAPLIAVVVAVALSAPAAAGAGTYKRVLSTYESTGSIPPCQFSSPQLEAALRGEDAYGAQYFADFTDAIQTALAQRASGACSGRARAAPSHAGGGLPGAGEGPVALPASATSPTDSPPPGVIVLLGILALAAGVAGVVLRLGAWRNTAWTGAAQHAAAEFAFRAVGRLERLVDLLRAGGRRPAP